MTSDDKLKEQLSNSPCIRNCCLDENDICLGCYRHIDEIVAWRSYNDRDKKNVIALCLQRRDKNR